MHINTNAVIFKTEFAEGLFSNRIQLLISADAGSPEVYKAIKGVDYFTSVWENIKKYNNACLNNNGLDYGQVYVKFILQTENKNDIQNIINMCKKNNVRNVVLDWNMYSVENPVDYSNEVLIFIQLCRANNLNFTYGRFMPPVLNQTSINQELSK
jgi:molybdenum cofactor biosynthesis enzyme MoaA